ncbi:MAG: hypothetical protein ACR2H2_15595 [Solirubrobacteraceae bacterium]
MTAFGARPREFFRSGWNVFDFVVILASFAPACARTRRSCDSRAWAGSSGSCACCPTCAS